MRSRLGSMMSQHFEDHIVRGIHRQAMTSGTVWPAHVVRALCEDLIRLRGSDRPWLIANPPEDEGGPRCGDVGSLGGGARGFVVCEKRAGHAADLYHLDGEWRWMTGEVAERF